MAVLHLFDSPLRAVAPVRGVHGLPDRAPARGRSRRRDSMLLDYLTPRAQVVEAIEAAYPGIRREHIHVWTLRGKSRVARLGPLWEEWSDARRAPRRGRLEDAVRLRRLHRLRHLRADLPRRQLEGRRRRDARVPLRRLRGHRRGDAGRQPLRGARRGLLDGAVLAHLRPAVSRRGAADAARSRLRRTSRAAWLALLGGRDVEAGKVESYADAIREAAASNLPLDRRVLRPTTSCRRSSGSVLASTGYMCDDPYTGPPGVEQIGDGAYRVTTRLATRKASSRIAFTFRLMEPLEQAKHVFSPLLVRFIVGRGPHARAPVKISDSGRIRNELQTMLSQALEYDGDTHPRPLRSHRRTGDAAREAGDHPRGPDLVQGEPPGVVRLAGHRLSAKAKRKGRRST